MEFYDVIYFDENQEKKVSTYYVHDETQAKIMFRNFGRTEEILNVEKHNKRQ